MTECVSLSQVAFACSESTIETLDLNLFNVNNEHTGTTSTDIVLVSLLLILNWFHTFF